MASQPSESQPPAPSTADPPPPLSPDATINNDPADPSFDPSSLDPDIDMNIDPSPNTQLPDAPQLDGPADNPDPANGTEDIKLPLQKDISLKDFLDKMDDYTPIVDKQIDPRRSNIPPFPPRRPPPGLHPAATIPPPRARHPEIHRRYRRGRVPVLPHAGQREHLLFFCQYRKYHQPHGAAER
ncbi:MAG: hypothetical protein LQ338_002636 [Usnochroma carphineum]|nr:MAG: hypothetical protein LQ338_002636 [Usnochroma carphineum]